MNLQITKLGIIKGGNCEKWFKDRSERERGVLLAIDWLLNHNCIEISKKMCKIVKVPPATWSIKKICRICGRVCDVEIGWRRFISDIAMPLCESGKKFRLTHLKKWGADLAALQFALTQTFKNHKLTYGAPHRPEIYKKWKGQHGGK